MIQPFEFAHILQRKGKMIRLRTAHLRCFCGHGIPAQFGMVFCGIADYSDEQ